MPYGRYPDRVKAFKKWATEIVDKGDLSRGSVTSAARRGKPNSFRRRRRRLKRRKRAQDP